MIVKAGGTSRCMVSIVPRRSKESVAVGAVGGYPLSRTSGRTSNLGSSQFDDNNEGLQ